MSLRDLYQLELPSHGECFTYDEGDGSPLMTLSTCWMQIFVDKYGGDSSMLLRKTEAIDPAHVDHLRRRGGIEQARLDRLCEPFLSRPALTIVRDKPPLGLTLVDGAHRVVRRHELGLTTFDVYVFVPELWRQFLVHNPDAPNWQTDDSRILQHEQTVRADD